MTSTTVSENWGEERLARRKRRIWRVKGALIAAAVAFPLAIDWLGGAHLSELHGGATVTHDGRSLTTSLALTVVYVAIVFTAAWFGWRNRDEVERAAAMRMFAAVGLSSMALYPVLIVAAPLWLIGDPARIVWLASVTIGVIVYIVGRLRGDA